jgi:hypothetical protein
MYISSLFRRGLVFLTAAGLFAAPAPPAFAWGQFAHRASAKLAESRLTPAARAAIREILEPGESLADASTWADEHSRDIPGSGAWHYVNVPISARSYDPRDCHGNCVVSRFEEFRAVLADRKAPSARRRMALRYVIHLLQDLHQPLHVGDNHDRGGNAVQLTYYRDDRTNLHQLWDSGLFRNRFRHENQLLEEIQIEANRRDARDWHAGSVEDWADESLQIAKTAYRVPGTNDLVRRGIRLGRDYELVNLPLATRRVAQSGVRLADVLNSILK